MLKYNYKIFKKKFRNILVIYIFIYIFVINFIVLAKNDLNINDIKENTNFNNKLILLNDKIYYYKNLEINYKIIDNFLDLIKTDDRNFLFLNFYNNFYNLYLFYQQEAYFWNFFRNFNIKKIYSFSDFSEYIGSFYKENYICLIFDKFIFVFELNEKFNIKNAFKYNIEDILKSIFKLNFKNIAVLYSYNNKILTKIDNSYFIFGIDFFNNKILLKLLKRISDSDKKNLFIINQLFVDNSDLVLYSFFEKINDEFYYIVQDIDDNCYYKVKAVNSYESNYIILDKIDKLLFIQDNNSIAIVYDKDNFILIENCGFYVSNIKFKNDFIFITLSNEGLIFYKFNKFNREVNPLFSIKDVIYAFRNQNYIYFVKKEESDYYYYLYFININSFINFFNNLDNKKLKDIDLEGNFTNFKLNFIPEKFFVFN